MLLPVTLLAHSPVDAQEVIEINKKIRQILYKQLAFIMIQNYGKWLVVKFFQWDNKNLVLIYKPYTIFASKVYQIF